MVFIAVHTGAGFYSSKNREKYLQICSRACEAAIEKLKNGSKAIDGVVEAIAYLENEVQTNSGYGSNLNQGGYVECDASLMDGTDLLFGSVGAIQSIKNPIKVAHLILEKQRIKLPLGLISPNFLVGDGAKKFAISNGLEEFDLVAKESCSVYNRYKKQLDEYRLKIVNKHKRYDTVGAVCIDQNGFFSSGVSSGGLILKQEGRIGQASIIGAGCWTEGKIAVTTSGVGEYLVRTLLARKMVEWFSKNDSEPTIQQLSRFFEKCFFGSPLMKDIPRDDHLVGILGLIHHEFKGVELFWAHSTPSMCIGYMHSSFSSGKSFLSEMNSTPGSTINAQSMIFNNL